MKITETSKEEFDMEIKEPSKNWRELIGGLRFLGNTVWPKISIGEEFEGWSKESVIESFAKTVDVLRGIFFPIILKDDKTSYWDLYHHASEFMESNPPTADEVNEWETKRKEIIKEDIIPPEVERKDLGGTDKKTIEERIDVLESKIFELKNILEIKKQPVFENLTFPLEIGHNGRIYTIKESPRGGLQMI